MPIDDTTKEEIAEELVRRSLRSYLASVIDDESMLEACLARDLAQGFSMTLSLENIKGQFSVQFVPLAAALVGKFDAEIDKFSIATPEGSKVFDWKDDHEREQGLKFFTDFAVCYLIPKIGNYVAEAIESLLEQSFSFAKTTGCLRIAKDYDEATGSGLDLHSLIADIRDAVKQAPPDKKEYIRKALEHYSGLQVQSVKGRPRTWTKESLEKAVRRASFQVRKEKYRTPTLEDVARDLNKRNPDRARLTGKALGQMLTRYEINWKGIKNPHN